MRGTSASSVVTLARWNEERDRGAARVELAGGPAEIVFDRGVGEHAVRDAKRTSRRDGS